MHIAIDIAMQRLQLIDNDAVVFEAAVSSAKNGVGEKNGSECTPRGWHTIRAMIGAGASNGTVFSGRRKTGEIFNTDMLNLYPNRDWILSRIIWLSGLEIGVNRLGTVDTMRRYIYIHGTAYEDDIGKPVSHGCIRMKNKDVIDLFDKLTPNVHVLIKENSDV